jgi:hypothetical protein
LPAMGSQSQGACVLSAKSRLSSQACAAGGGMPWAKRMTNEATP